jgi:hypothetical protein
VQTALQYGEARTTIVLPLRSEPDAARSAAVDGFLTRQLTAGRQVIALLVNTPRPPDPLASRFDSEVLFSQGISFLELPQLAASQVSSTKATTQLRYYAHELRPIAETPHDARIPRTLSDGVEFSRPVLSREIAGMAGLSHAEADGRWTDGPVARLRFAERLPARFVLELDIVDVYPPNRGRPLTARVGREVREASLPHDPGTLRLAFASGLPANVIELRIPNPTSPASRGESQDARLLGIRLRALRVVKLPE